MRSFIQEKTMMPATAEDIRSAIGSQTLTDPLLASAERDDGSVMLGIPITAEKEAE